MGAVDAALAHQLGSFRADHDIRHLDRQLSLHRTQLADDRPAATPRGYMLELIQSSDAVTAKSERLAVNSADIGVAGRERERIERG